MIGLNGNMLNRSPRRLRYAPYAALPRWECFDGPYYRGLYRCRISSPHGEDITKVGIQHSYQHFNDAAILLVDFYELEPVHEGNRPSTDLLFD